MIFTSEKSLREAGDKVNADIKKEVEEKISALKSILDTGTKEDIEAKTKDLSDSLQKVGQAMYASQSQQQPGQGQTAGNNQSTADGQTKTDDKKSDDKDEPVEGEVVN